MRTPLLLMLAMLRPAGAGAQSDTLLPSPPPAPAVSGTLSNAGVLRASAIVDSVFVDRVAARGLVAGADWVSYLAARLGVPEIPRTRFLVTGDSGRLYVDGTIGDLPPETQAMFGPLSMFFDSTTTLRATVAIAPSQRGVVRFRLTGIAVNGFTVPEVFLGPVFMNVGKQYPMLTETGRDLFVQIPPDGGVALLPEGVRLWIEPSAPS